MKSRLYYKLIFYGEIASYLFPYIFISIYVLQTLSAEISAQSILSDRSMIEQNIDAKKDNETFIIEKNLEIGKEIKSSKLLSRYTINEKNKLQKYENRDLSDHPQYLFNPTLGSIVKKNSEKDVIFSSSFLSKLYPWFSSDGPLHRNNLNKKSLARSEIKDWNSDQIFDINITIDQIERLMVKNPFEAREKYLKIENKLEIEERTRLKVKLFYYLNEFESAELLAKTFLTERKKSPLSPEIFYYLNKTLKSQKKILSQNKILRELSLKELRPKMRNDYLQMLSDEALSLGNFFTAVQFRLERISNNKKSKLAEREKLFLLMEKINFVKDLENLSESFPNLLWMQDRLPLLKLKLLVKQKNYRNALGLVYSQIDIAKEAEDLGRVELFKKMESNFNKLLNLKPYRIGVILPLSSSNAKIAGLSQETLNGLWLALNTDNKKIENTTLNNHKSSPKIKDPKGVLSKSNLSKRTTKYSTPREWELVIRDSNLNPAKTKSAVRELIEKEGVMAIIGPLARKTSEAAAEEAERLRVPLISLSLTDKIPELGDYIFRNNQSWKQEVEELLDYAIGELQACRFLILFSETREGRQKMRHFWDNAILKGCEVFAVEGFKNEGHKSLVNEFDRFTGKIKRLSNKEKNILKELKEKEVPIHNFDAVFVAVGSGGVKNLRLIFPYSAVYKMEKVIFLGDSGWNDDALMFAPGLSGIKKTIFVDSFYPNSKTPAMERLLKLHERVLYRHQNYQKPTHYTAYAYDTLMILMYLLKEKKNHSHYELRNAIANIQNFSGVTGNLSFDEKGEIQREIQLLTLRRGKISLLKK